MRWLTAVALGVSLIHPAWAGNDGGVVKEPRASNPVRPLVKFPQVRVGGELVVNPGIQKTLQIVYDPGIEPTTFSAKLNGHPATKLFNPATPTYKELVSLPLVQGRNTLEIEVNSREAVKNSRSLLLPQSHTLVIRVEPLGVQMLKAEKKAFQSEVEADAQIKARKEEFIRE